MSHGHCEITAYINSGDIRKITDDIVSLCEREGMRRIDCVPIRVGHGVAATNNYWAIAVIPGKAGWCIVKSNPGSLLCEQADGNNRRRFVDLCASLGAPGFLIDVMDGGPWGELVVETDGMGQEVLSGWYCPYVEGGGTPPFAYYGKPLDKDQAEIGFKLFAHLDLVDRAKDSDFIADHRIERLCQFIAADLGGHNGRFWGQVGWELIYEALCVGGPMPVPDGILMSFEWPAKDRPMPQPSEYELALQAFWKESHFSYANGEEIRNGDSVRLENGQRGTIVSLMATNHPAGTPVPGGATVEIGGGQWVMDMASLHKMQLLSRSEHAPSSADRQSIEAAAERGDASAQHHLGLIYANGQGVLRNNLTSTIWYRKAAEQGYRDAQYELGVKLWDGLGVLTDWKEAERWLLKAADKGHAKAQDKLIYMSQFKGGYGVHKDGAETAKWARMAAEQGDDSAQYKLAYKYEFGNGVPQNYEQAVYWYRMAAEQGNSAAQCNLADKYEHGLGVQQDYEQALNWYLKSAAQDNYVAQYSLGMMYKNGLGVLQDMQRAENWLRKSAAHGYADAKTELQAISK